MTASEKISKGLKTFASDVADGFFEITHNSFALVGLAVIFATITLVARPDLRDAGEMQLARSGGNHSGVGCGGTRYRR